MNTQLTPEFWDKYVAMCWRLKVNPVHLAMVIYSESGWNPSAYNPQGPASGLIQWMNGTLKGLGFIGDCVTMVRTLPIDQLQWIEKYYQPHTQWLTDPGSVYCVNFMPAYIGPAKRAEAAGQRFALGMKDGAGYSGLVYKLNAGLDQDRDGMITLSDLGAHIASVCKGKAWEEIGAAILLASGSQLPQDAPGRVFDWRATYACKQVQRALQRLGRAVSVDGQFGPVTTGAVKDFQYQHKLAADGLAGPVTRKAMALALKEWKKSSPVPT